MRLQNPVIHLLKSIRNYQTVAPQRAEPETLDTKAPWEATKGWDNKNGRWVDIWSIFKVARWWFQRFSYFHPYWRKMIQFDSYFLDICEMCWNHQLGWCDPGKLAWYGSMMIHALFMAAGAQTQAAGSKRYPELDGSLPQKLQEMQTLWMSKSACQCNKMWPWGLWCSLIF